VRVVEVQRDAPWVHGDVHVAEYVVVGEPGCLMNVAVGLERIGSPIKAVSLIEVLSARG